MTKASENVIHRVTSSDGILVEVVDLERNATPEQSNVPVEVRPTVVEFLSNGWIRCRTSDDAEDNKASFDYYPPERVNGVFTVEHKNSDIGYP